MEVLNSVQQITHWITQNALWCGLAIFVFFQWAAFQVLLIHYHLFRQNLKTPKPSQLRFQSIEKTMEFQMQQMDKLFEKMAELRKEIHAKPAAAPEAYAGESLESRFMTIGEMKLKQRLSDIKSRLS